MNSISFRHEYLIKTAVSKQKFIQDLTDKYGPDVIKENLGLISRFHDQNKLKEVNTLGAEYADIMSSISSDWNEAKAFMQSKISSGAKDLTKDKLISLGLKEEELANKEVREWLSDRYILNNTQEIHPIDEASETVNDYMKNKDAILSKLKNDNEFEKRLQERRISEEKLKNQLSLSVDDMVFIIGSFKNGVKTTIRTVGVEIRPEEKIGKVGEWNIWLPKTQETSAKIAGYDEITKDPVTTWCTNRTKGSNLFYHYISRGDTIAFLFYIIKDDPKLDEDWLSFGFIGRKSSGVNSVRPVYGQNGGMTVDRANTGLNESDFKRILGGNWEKIFGMINNTIRNLNGINPATEELTRYAQDIDLFKSELKNKSAEEKKDFCDIILKLNPSDLVRRFTQVYTEHPDYIIGIKGNKPDEYEPNEFELEMIDAAYRRMAEEYAPAYLRFFVAKSYPKKYLGLAVKNLIEHNVFDFLQEYSDNEWAKKYIDVAAKKAFEQNKSVFLKLFFNKEWARSYIDEGCRSTSEDDPKGFLIQFGNRRFAIPYNEGCVKKIISTDPSFLIFYCSGYSWAKEEWAIPYMESAAKITAESEPWKFLIYRRDNPSDLLDSYTDFASERLLEKTINERITKNNSYDILRELVNSAWAENIIKRTALALVDFSFKKGEDSPFLEYFLRAYSNREWAKDVLPSIIDHIGIHNPEYIISFFLSKNTNYDKLFSYDYVKNILKILIEKLISSYGNVEDFIQRFLAKYGDSGWYKTNLISDILDSLAKNLAETEPRSFINSFDNEEDWYKRNKEFAYAKIIEQDNTDDPFGIIEVLYKEKIKGENNEYIRIFDNSLDKIIKENPKIIIDEMYSGSIDDYDLIKILRKSLGKAAEQLFESGMDPAEFIKDYSLNRHLIDECFYVAAKYLAENNPDLLMQYKENREYRNDDWLQFGLDIVKKKQAEDNTKESGYYPRLFKLSAALRSVGLKNEAAIIMDLC